MLKTSSFVSFLLQQSVGLSSYDIIAFKSCSKHVASMLISSFCPITLLSTPPHTLHFEDGMFRDAFASSQNKQWSTAEEIRVADQSAACLRQHFLFSTVPHRLLMCAASSTSLQSFEEVRVRGHTAHQMANSTSGCLLLPVILSTPDQHAGFLFSLSAFVAFIWKGFLSMISQPPYSLIKEPS